uniref:Uncharacterized protein n=1 Tax=Caenorhabditis japonica TaxID=281687 RepID=A0A8R1I7S8_CAEJA
MKPAPRLTDPFKVRDFEFTHKSFTKNLNEPKTGRIPTLSLSPGTTITSDEDKAEFLADHIEAQYKNQSQQVFQIPENYELSQPIPC